MLIKQGLRLVTSGSVAQANMKLATVNAGAMIDIGVDWSAYAGDDVGSTPYMLILYDSAGKRMQGFIGASGGGEAYGAELITGDNSNFTGGLGDWPTNNTWHSQTNPAANMALVSNAIGQFSYINPVSLENKLYKLTYDASGKVGSPKFTFWDGSSHVTIDRVENGAQVAYTTKEGSTTNFYIFALGDSNEVTLDNILLKQVTDISTNGVHLHSTRGGTNRNVASIDSGFDLNDSSGFTFKLYKCS